MSLKDRDELLVPHDLATDLITIIRNSSRPIAPIPTGVTSRSLAPLPISAVLFDIYGTLFVSSSGDRNTSIDGTPSDYASGFVVSSLGLSFVDAIESSGCRVIDRESCARVAEAEYFRSIDSIHREKRSAGFEYPEVDILTVWKDVFGELTGSALVDAPDDPATLFRVATAFECATNPVWPMPGALRLLRHLAAADIVLGIVSNAQFYTALLFPALLRRTLAALQFDARVCVWSYQAGVAKPGISLFEDAAELLLRLHGIRAAEVLYIGNDMRNDIAPSIRTGFRTALFAGDHRSLRMREDDPDCRNAVPDAIVTNLSDLESLVSSETQKRPAAPGDHS